MNEINRENMRATAKHHIKELNDYLNNIYSIETPDIFKHTKQDNINVVIELEQIKILEEIYSVVEQHSEGEIFEKYITPLNNVRKLISYLEEAKATIEKENKSDIINAKNLIEEFSKYL